MASVRPARTIRCVTKRWNSPNLRDAYDAARNQVDCPPDQTTITYQIVRNEPEKAEAVDNEPSAARSAAAKGQRLIGLARREPAGQRSETCFAIRAPE